MSLFQINDWPIRRFIIVVMTLQISLLSLIYIEELQIKISFIREIVAFFLLSFIPGFTILRILRLHNLGNIRSFLFAVGVSISFVIFIGLFNNALFPEFGILRPISIKPLLFTFNLFILIFLVFAYRIDSDYIPSSPKIDFIRNYLNIYLFLSIIILSVGLLGILIKNYYNNNFILMVFILILSIIPLIVALAEIPRRMYPIMIFTISITLMYHVSLFSPYILLGDIFGEFYFANLSIIDGIWHPFNFTHLLNSVLSLTLLPPIFQLLCNLSLTYYFKIISPFFFSLAVVGLYYIYETVHAKELNHKEIFFAIFYIMSTWIYYGLMPGASRQQLGELFYILILIVVVSNEKIISYKVLLVLFSASLVFMHYSMAMLFLIFIITVVLIKYAVRNDDATAVPQIKTNFLFLILIFNFAWYLYISNGSIFNCIVLMGDSIYNAFSGFSTKENNAAIRIFTTTSKNMAHIIYSYLYYFFLLFLSVGIIKLLISLISKKIKSHLDYRLLLVANVCLLGVYAVVPLIGFQLGIERVFHISCLILAPYIIIGVKSIIEIFFCINPKLSTIKCEKTINIIIAVLISSFLLFNSGFIFEIINDPSPNSIPLSLGDPIGPIESNRSQGLMLLKINTLTTSEVFSAEWLKTKRNITTKVYTSWGGSSGLSSYGMLYNQSKFIQVDDLSKSINGLYYYNYINKKLGYTVIRFSTTNVTVRQIDRNKTNMILSNTNKVYASSNDEIYEI